MKKHRDVERALALLNEAVRHVAHSEQNRSKPDWSGEPVEKLLRLSEDEIGEALHALRCRGREATRLEIGDAALYLAMAISNLYPEGE